MNAALPTEERPAAKSATAVIEMNDVSVGVAGVVETVSVEGIEYCVASGDYWVIGGPPGSGKTDLLATLAGLYRPLKGTLRLFGDDVAQLGEEDFLAARLRIGLVFENGGRLFNHLSVAENIASPLRYHHEKRRTATGDSGSVSPVPSPWTPKSCCSTIHWPVSAPRNHAGGANSCHNCPQEMN